MESFLSARNGHWSVHGLPAFQDNYLWVIVNENTKQAGVVDPGCAETVRRFLVNNDLTLTDILVTHHHPDHIGGLAQLTQSTDSKFPVPKVTGTRSGRISPVDKAVGQDDIFDTVLGLKIKAIEVPGHTSDHLAYLVEFDGTGQAGWLFCGDTLFSSGCGRLFEGSFEQMYASLRKLSELPDATLVFCAHEYTTANVRFSLAYAPNDAALQEESQRVKNLIVQGLSTIPTSIGHEKRVNLFLRASSVEDFAKVRAAKDRF